MPDPRCKKIFAALSEYLDGELPVRNCRELERHLKGCEPCVAYLESLKMTVEACRKYKVQSTTPLSARVREAIRKATERIRKG